MTAPTGAAERNQEAMVARTVNRIGIPPIANTGIVRWSMESAGARRLRMKNNDPGGTREQIDAQEACAACGHVFLPHHEKLKIDSWPGFVFCKVCCQYKDLNPGPGAKENAI